MERFLLYTTVQSLGTISQDQPFLYGGVFNKMIWSNNPEMIPMEIV